MGGAMSQQVTLAYLADLVLGRAAELRRYGTEEADWPEFGDDIEQLWLTLGDAEYIQRAARELVEHVKSVMAAQLDGRAIRLGDVIYSTRPDVTERLTDPRGLIEWLGDDWHHVIPVTASTRLRKQALRAIAERRGVDVESVLDTFVEVEEGSEKLQAVPVAKAAKWLQALRHGETVERRRKGGGDE